MSRKAKIIHIVCLTFYLFLVLYFTFLGRSPSIPNYNTEIFWSYREWMTGNWKTGLEIIGNIAIFIPIGFICSRLLDGRKHPVIMIIVFSAVVSCGIEILQLLFMRGLFEYDDMINNTVGGLIGCFCYRMIAARIDLDITKGLSIAIGVLSICGIIYVILTAGENADTSCQMYCFQIDEITANTIKGVAFRYEKPTQEFDLFLKSTDTGDIVELTNISLEERKDVNEYFDCEYDYTNSGFKADLGEIDTTQEYEFLINWGWRQPLSTGVYFTGDNVHYAPQTSYDSGMFDGTDLEHIARDGQLRVCRQDISCYVYQLDGFFYWVFGKDYSFDNDNTLIQYQLWTTQSEKLPSERISEGYEWDNKTDVIEKYELTGSFGDFRVFRRSVPTEYAVSSVLTGYYHNHKWIWQSYFRPIYSF